MLTSSHTGAPIYARKPSDLQRGDEVELIGGNRMIVTGINPKAVVNVWTGVKANGLGKEYVFGPRHMPQKIASHGENHPALRKNAERIADRAESQAARTGHTIITVEQKEKIGAMILAVRSGDSADARKMADELHAELGPWA